MLFQILIIVNIISAYFEMIGNFQEQVNAVAKNIIKVVLTAIAPK
jgi:hypothetical protein